MSAALMYTVDLLAFLPQLSGLHTGQAYTRCFMKPTARRPRAGTSDSRQLPTCVSSSLGLSTGSALSFSYPSVGLRGKGDNLKVGRSGKFKGDPPTVLLENAPSHSLLTRRYLLLPD